MSAPHESHSGHHHHHRHHHRPAQTVLAQPAVPALSLLTLSLGVRLSGALVLIALIWGLILWALQ